MSLGGKASLSERLFGDTIPADVEVVWGQWHNPCDTARYSPAKSQSSCQCPASLRQRYCLQAYTPGLGDCFQTSEIKETRGVFTLVGQLHSCQCSRNLEKGCECIPSPGGRR